MKRFLIIAALVIGMVSAAHAQSSLTYLSASPTLSNGERFSLLGNINGSLIVTCPDGTCGAAAGATVPVTLANSSETGCSTVGSAAGSTSCTLSGVSGKFTYLTAIDLSCDPASGTITAGTATITGAAGGTYNVARVTESQAQGWAYAHTYIPPIVSSGSNTSLVVNIPAITNGGICVAAARGYTQ